jgi:hypothetical protein
MKMSSQAGPKEQQNKKYVKHSASVGGEPVVFTVCQQSSFFDFSDS